MRRRLAADRGSDREICQERLKQKLPVTEATTPEPEMMLCCLDVFGLAPSESSVSLAIFGSVEEIRTRPREHESIILWSNIIDDCTISKFRSRTVTGSIRI